MLKQIPILLAVAFAACSSGPDAQSPPTQSSADVELPVVTDSTSDLTIERLYASPSLSGPSPRGVKFSPDGKRVTFLKAREDENSRFDLWQFDVATGTPSILVDSKLLEPEDVELSEEEKALRERKRIAGSKGIVSYDWGTDSTILIPIGGDLHLVTVPALGAESPAIALDMKPLAAEVGISASKARTVLEAAMTGSEDLDYLDVRIEAEDGTVYPLSHLAEVRLHDGQQATTRQLTSTDAFEYDAKVSPGGQYVSFVRNGAVWAIELDTGKEQRLTPAGQPDRAVAYGVAEFVAQEEMSRYTGYWWSPDERYVAYTKVDETSVDIIPRFDIRAEDVAVIEQRYPRAGRPNAVVDLFVRDMQNGSSVPVLWRLDDWGPSTDQYLARVNWQDERLIVQSVNRDQTELRLAEWDNTNGKITKLGSDGDVRTRGIDAAGEHHDTWINLSDDFQSLENGQFLTTYERPTPATHMKAWSKDGTETRFWDRPGAAYRHVWLHQGGDKPDRQITMGNWAVDSILHADADTQTFYFTGYMDAPLERHLYRFGWDEKSESYEPILLTELGKSWAITMSPDGASFVGTSSSPTEPPQTGLYKADGSLIAWVEENALSEDHPYAPYLAGHTVPEYGTLKSENGMDLHYSIQKPLGFDAKKTYPVLVEVYGGPHAQLVTRNWERLSDQFYSRQGYIVFRLDNRGSANRGKAFEDVIYRQTGGPEVRDQLVGVEWLKSQPFVDSNRIAIQGWSYGGYMTLMTILQAPEGTFAAAVAGAPVTDWSLYDTFYTERYMDTPQDNADGYEKSSVFYHLERLQGEMTPLLLIHGMADDNVTFDNTTRLMAALQEAERPFELMTYPGQRHGIRGEKLQIHLMKTRMAFLDRKLKGESE